MSTILEVKDLSVKLNETPIVRHIDFTIGSKEIVGLVGESGSGKSLTAKSIIKLLPSIATLEGQILFNGSNLIPKSEIEMEQIRGKEIGMIFQDPMSALNPIMKISTQMTEGMAKHLKLSKKECYNRALELLEAVEISDPEQRMNQYPFELSGGMRQRVLIAMALTCNPKLLIADEPTTALDANVQSQVLVLLKKIRDKWGLAILLITHDLSVVAETCDKVMVMYAGKVVEYGSPKQVLQNPQHPYTQALLRSKPTIGQTSQLQPIKGYPPNMANLPQGCAFHPRCANPMEICRISSPPFFANNAACWLHHEFCKGKKDDR